MPRDQDLTGRRQRDESSKERQSILESLADAVPAAISIIGDQKLLYVNQFWEQTTGYCKAEALAMDPRLLFHPSMTELVFKRGTDRLQGKTVPDRYEAKIVRKDGQERWIDFSAKMIQYQNRPAILTIALDITETKEIEKALQEEENRYRILYENSIDPIFITQEGVIKMANKATEKLIGYSEQELGGMHFINLIHPLDRELVMEQQKARIAGEVEYSDYSHRALTKAGDTIWVHVHGVRIEWGGQPAGLVFVRDITENKRLEEEKEEHLKQLQKALDEIKVLRGIIPICSYCKKIRDDKGAWDEFEKYIANHSEAEFSHGICPECTKKYFSEFIKTDDD